MKNLLKFLLLLSDEIILLVVAFVLLPKWGLHLHWGILVALIIVLGILSFLLYKLITPISKKKPVSGPEALIGARGKVVQPLTPEGMVQLGNELWKASAVDSHIDTGCEVIVVGRKGLCLTVRCEIASGEH